MTIQRYSAIVRPRYKCAALMRIVCWVRASRQVWRCFVSLPPIVDRSQWLCGVRLVEVRPIASVSHAEHAHLHKRLGVACRLLTVCACDWLATMWMCVFVCVELVRVACDYCVGVQQSIFTSLKLGGKKSIVCDESSKLTISSPFFCLL